MPRSPVLLLLLTFSLTAYAQAKEGTFSNKAIWHPSQAALQRIMQCRDNPTGVVECITRVMKENGATEEAIAFTRRLEGIDFMTSFAPYGKIAFVTTLELGADHSSGYFLVNGEPGIINLNDTSQLEEGLWPTDHQAPRVQQLPGRRQAFFFTYPKKACHACRETGHQEVVFLFDSQGKLLKIATDGRAHGVIFPNSVVPHRRNGE